MFTLLFTKNKKIALKYSSRYNFVVVYIKFLRQSKKSLKVGDIY